MKVRNGFVSNSSSSSFILALSGIPTSEADLKERLGVACDDQTLADIWVDFKTATRVEENEIARMAAFGAPCVTGFDEPKRPKALSPAAWDEYFRDRQMFGRRVARIFINTHPGTLFFRFRSPKYDGHAFRTLGAGLAPDDRPYIEIVED